MIAYIKGTIIHKNDKFIILENGDIGYQIFSTEVVLNSAKEGEIIKLFIHQQVKEDTLDLYGFSNMDELDFFKHLLSISGVGPRSALAVLSIAKIEDIKQAIYQGDPTLLKKVSGIGQKTAERIVVELKNKVSALTSATGEMFKGVSDELIDALEALGYKPNIIRQAISQLPEDIKDLQEKVKATLKIINNK
ncbi:Holliday junction branch migration protein RuvA [Patescibacteria group bacterium]|nr:Holliday junction branch migration protein RuvA [Patescibacteria group bacterium]